MQQISVLLHNVRSAHNVGSIFRTSDAAGVTRIYLTGYTPTPTDRFGRPQKDIAKTALGAQLSVPWEYHKAPAALIRKLKRGGRSIVGVELDAHSKDYRSYRAGGPTVFVFGNEVRGLSLSLRRGCDALIEIPMHGEKESLNVSVTAGIILFNAINT